MKNSEQSAFPNDYSQPINKGLTKREYFAGLAMQGICAHESMRSNSAESIVKEAIKVADELLAQLENGSK